MFGIDASKRKGGRYAVKDGRLKLGHRGILGRLVQGSRRIPKVRIDAAEEEEEGDYGRRQWGLEDVSGVVELFSEEKMRSANSSKRSSYASLDDWNDGKTKTMQELRKLPWSATLTAQRRGVALN